MTSCVALNCNLCHLVKTQHAKKNHMKLNYNFACRKLVVTLWQTTKWGTRHQ